MNVPFKDAFMEEPKYKKKFQERKELEICFSLFIEFIQHICSNEGLCDTKVTLGLEAGMCNLFWTNSE